MLTNEKSLENVTLSFGSHIKVEAKCQCNQSKKCLEVVEREYRDVYKNIKRYGVYICKNCILDHIYLGEGNPNNKYEIDQNYFSNIDSEEKSYILGWIASDGYVREDGWSISVHEKDVVILDKIRKAICKNIQLNKYTSNQINLTINSKKHSNDLKKLLKLEFDNGNKKSSIVEFPKIGQSLEKYFIRGYFDGDGCVSNYQLDDLRIRASISSNSKEMLISISEKIGVPCGLYEKSLEYTNINALDFLGKIYESWQHQPYWSLDRKYNMYDKISQWVPSFGNCKSINDPCGLIKFYKTRPDAVLPSKKRISDSGYDLTLLEPVWTSEYISLYHTGIKVRPPYGWYFDVVPRSSIIKTGYQLSNSVAVIDRSYLGEIMIPLNKVDKNAKDLELPNRLVQLIPRPIVHFPIEEVFNEEELGNSDRNEKGFGSSGNT